VSGDLSGPGWALDRLRRAGSELVFGEAFERARSVFRATQWAPAEAVRELQWGWVRAILNDAYEAGAFYRQRLERAGWPRISPDSFRQIPPLTRRDLEIYLQDVGRQRSWGRLRRTSGGSGGAAIAIPLDRETYGWYIAGTRRGIGWWGADLGEPAIVLLGGSRGSPQYMLPKVAKDWVMNWRRAPVDDDFDGRAPQVLDDIERVGPAYLYGYPSAVHCLVRAVRDRGRGLRHRLTVIVLTGEPLYAFQRRTIEDAFQCPVAEEYGSGELGCMAFQCPQGGLHVTVENVFIEATAIAPSEADHGGGILVTQLRNRVFPLIRYDTGDAAVLTAVSCPCGRGLPTLRLLGRAQDVAVNREGVVPVHSYMEQVFSLLPEHLCGRVRIANEAAGDIVLQVEQGIASRADMARIASLAADVFGSAWHARVAEVERFRRLPSGKLPYFLPIQVHA